MCYPIHSRQDASRPVEKIWSGVINKSLIARLFLSLSRLGGGHGGYVPQGGRCFTGGASWCGGGATACVWGNNDGDFLQTVIYPTFGMIPAVDSRQVACCTAGSERLRSGVVTDKRSASVGKPK